MVKLVWTLLLVVSYGSFLTKCQELLYYWYNYLFEFLLVEKLKTEISLNFLPIRVRGGSSFYSRLNLASSSILYLRAGRYIWIVNGKLGPWAAVPVQASLHIVFSPLTFANLLKTVSCGKSGRSLFLQFFRRSQGKKVGRFGRFLYF